MKKSLVSIILTLSILATFSTPVFAYTPAIRTSNGNTLEAEPNDIDEDATILFRIPSDIYLCTGSIRYVEDCDNYVYQCTKTQKRTLILCNNSALRVPDTDTYLSIFDVTDCNPISEQRVVFNRVGTAAKVPFQTIAGHDYIITVALEGPVDDIQAWLDYLATINDKGHSYAVFVK